VHDKTPARPIFLYAATIGLVWFSLINLWPFVASFFEAVVLFVLFNALYLKAERLTGSRMVSALGVILLTFIMIIVPILFVIPTLISNVPRFYKSLMWFLSQPVEWPGFLQVFVQSNTFLVNQLLPGAVGQLVSKSGDFVLAAITNVGGFFINIIIMYVILFFAFTEQTRWISGVMAYWPSKRIYLDKITDIFRKTIRSFVISTVVVALFQGLSLGAVLFGTATPNAFVLMLIACVLSFIPMIGVPFIWVPVAIYHLIHQQLIQAIIVLVMGVLISNLDNLIRPWVQKRIGKIHPLTTIFGIIVGLPLFGISGLVIGPVMIGLTASLSGFALEQYNQDLIA
jgi:predicted PurR-regulated permease PerM